MKCEKIREKLSLYIDNQLDLAESEQIKEHINECEECRLYYNKLVSLGELVDSFELRDNEEYWESQKDKVLDRINQEESEKITDIKTGRNRSNMYKFLAVAASIVLVAIVSIYESRDIRQAPGLFNDRKQIQVDRSSNVPDTATEIIIKPENANVDDEVNPSITAMPKKDEAKKSIVSPEPIDNEPKSEGLNSEKQSLELGAPGEAYEIVQPDEYLPVEDANESMATKLRQNTLDQISADFAEIEGAGRYEKEADSGPVTEAQKPLEVVESKAKMEYLSKAGDKNVVESTGDNRDKSAKRVKVTAMPMGNEEYNFKPQSLTEDKAMQQAPEEDTINIWLVKLDSLETKYEGIYSPHYIESSAKSRTNIPPDSMNTIILEIAETCFQAGLTSKDNQIREEMMDKLRRLADNGGPEAVEKIQRYIARLLSAD